jgi:hypothetical protein
VQQQALEDEVDRLKRLKSIHDDVKKSVNAQADATAKLATVMQQNEVPVVDVLTRFYTKFYEAQIERKNADADLTAQVLVNARLRADAIQDEAGSTLRAFRNLQLEYGKQEDDLRKQLQQDTVFLQALNGSGAALQAMSDVSIQQALGGRDFSQGPQVPQEMKDVAARAASLDANVAQIVSRMGGTPTIVSEAKSADATTGTTTVGDDEVLRIKKQIQGLTLEEQIRTVATIRAQSERTHAARVAVEETLTNEGRLHNQLIDFETDLARVRSAQAVQREQDERRADINIALLNEDLTNAAIGDEETLRRMRKSAEEQRLSAHLSLKQSIVAMEDEIAHAGEDAADRERAAFVSALVEIKRAHEDAAASAIRSQVRLADQTVYHADIANAKVLDFLASQKSITDTIADAKVGVIQSTFDYMSQGLDRITHKLGSIGTVINELIVSLLRLALMPALTKLFGLGNASSTGNVTGSGGSLLGNIFSSVFSPGAGSSAAHGGVFGTPNFNPNAQGGLANIFSGGLSNFQSPSLRGLSLGGSGLGSPGFLPTLSSLSALSAGAPGFLPTLSSQISSQAGITSAIHEAAHASVLSSIAPNLGPLGAFTPALALAAPLLGGQLGSLLGGSSRLGQGVGLAGGALAGTAIGALLLSGTSIVGAGGALAGLGGAVTAIAGAAPFLLPAAAAALIAAYFIGRSNERRKEETQRTQILTDAKSQLLQLVEQAKHGNLSEFEAKAAAQSIRSQYIAQVSQLKDKKTRDIALATVRELDYIINNQLIPAAKESDKAKERDKAIVPTFSRGGSGLARCIVWALDDERAHEHRRADEHRLYARTADERRDSHQQSTASSARRRAALSSDWCPGLRERSRLTATARDGCAEHRAAADIRRSLSRRSERRLMALECERESSDEESESVNQEAPF